MKMLYVRWVDSGAHVDHGWASKADYLREADATRLNVETVGFLMDEDEDVLALGSSYDAHGDMWNGAQLIYKENILEREELITVKAVQAKSFLSEFFRANPPLRGDDGG